MMLTYYRQLGVYPGATDAQVQRAIRRYWQRVARFRPAAEQQAFLEVAAVLGNPYLRAAYDPAYRPAASLREVVALYGLKSSLSTRLQKEQARSLRLEQEIRRLRTELSHALSYSREMAARRQERWRRRRGWLGVGLLVAVGYCLLHSLADGPGYSWGGPPYEPVPADANGFSNLQPDSLGVYGKSEQMPQYPGGVAGLRDFLRQQVYDNARLANVKRLCETGQVRFVVDSTGRVRPPVQALGLPADDSVGRQLLRQAVARLPRLVPGYLRARPVPVRLTVSLAR